MRASRAPLATGLGNKFWLCSHSWPIRYDIVNGMLEGGGVGCKLKNEARITRASKADKVRLIRLSRGCLNWAKTLGEGERS